MKKYSVFSWNKGEGIKVNGVKTFETAEGAIGFVKSGAVSAKHFDFYMIINTQAQQIVASFVWKDGTLLGEWTKIPTDDLANRILLMEEKLLEDLGRIAINAIAASVNPEAPKPIQTKEKSMVEESPVGIDQILKEDIDKNSEDFATTLVKYYNIGKANSGIEKFEFAKAAIDEIDAVLEQVAREQAIIEKVDEDERWDNLKKKLEGNPDLKPFVDQVNDIFDEVDKKHTQVIKEIRDPLLKTIREKYTLPSTPAPDPIPAPAPEPTPEPAPLPEPVADAGK